MPALPIRLHEDRIHIGDRFSLSLQRTLRIPDDDQTYPLPPGLGRFPIRASSAFPDRAPPAWLAKGAFFAPVYRREAMWISFNAAPWKPTAVKVGLGGVNAVSGAVLAAQLATGPQDYLVCPPQLWLDGINGGHGFVRQFVATELGMGWTVEAQVSGSEVMGGLQLIAYEPNPGKFPDVAPPPRPGRQVMRGLGQQADRRMGLAAGGKMSQKIYPDPHGPETWDQGVWASVFIHLISPGQYSAITGEAPPPTPIDAATYTAHGFPWFELYDEGMGDLAPQDALAQVRSLAELSRDDHDPDREATIRIDQQKIHRIRGDSS